MYVMYVCVSRFRCVYIYTVCDMYMQIYIYIPIICVCAHEQAHVRAHVQIDVFSASK